MSEDPRDRVVEAARKFVSQCRADGGFMRGAAELFATVDALPRPLAERLPGLRPGAVVATKATPKRVVVANDPVARELWLRNVGTGDGNSTCCYAAITAIISEPEATP